MTNVCRICHKLLDDGSQVAFTATGTYHVIGSTNTWALERDIQAVTDSLAHKECYEKD